MVYFLRSIGEPASKVLRLVSSPQRDQTEYCTDRRYSYESER